MCKGTADIGMMMLASTSSELEERLAKWQDSAYQDSNTLGAFSASDRYYSLINPSNRNGQNDLIRSKLVTDGALGRNIS